ncbi:hypothetical protein H7E67_10940 [Clostridium gasigenes]|uniref:hypothetical protein n=1 Tax=Clostridium gasigenes TaxID=94869 RepID=UPI001624AD39|nr:hypothetical protein [Clostridium gasigenes]MBB6623943.1 hypothetical protein [Clostridium gasigenes]
MKSIIVKNPVITTFLFDICVIFISIIVMINNKLNLPIYLLGFPLGYVNLKVMCNNALDKKSKLLIIVSLFLTFIVFTYACFIKK